MAKIQIKSEKLTPFGGFFSIMEQFDALLAQTIDSTLLFRCTLFCYQYSEILLSLMCVYLCCLKSGQEYDFDFDHQFIETEKYDAKPTYKKFLGYSPGVAVINDMIVGIEFATKVRFIFGLCKDMRLFFLFFPHTFPRSPLVSSLISEK